MNQGKQQSRERSLKSCKKLRPSGNSIFSAQGLNFFTPRPEDEIIGKLTHTKKRTKSKESRSSSKKRQLTRGEHHFQVTADIRNQSPKILKSIIKKKLTMKKNNGQQALTHQQVQKPLQHKENINIVIQPNTINPLTQSQGISSMNMSQGIPMSNAQLHQSQMNNSNAFQNFAKAAIQVSNSTKNQNAQVFFQPLVENSNLAKKLNQISNKTSNKQSRNPSAKARKNVNIITGQNTAPNNQQVFIVDQQSTNRNQSNSIGRDGSNSSGKKVRILQTYESPSILKDSKQNKFNIKNPVSQEKIQLQNIQAKGNNFFMSNQNHGSVDLSENSPKTMQKQSLGNINNMKYSEYLVTNAHEQLHQRSHPVTTTNAAFVSQMNKRQGQAATNLGLKSSTRHSSKRRYSKGLLVNEGGDAFDQLNHHHFQSYQQDPLPSDMMNSIGTVSQREFYKAAEILNQHALQLKLTSKNKKKKSKNYTMATSSIASGGSIEPLMSSHRHQLKIKPPKHSFNTQLKSNTNLQSPAKHPAFNSKNLVQQIVNSPVSSPSQNNQNNQLQHQQLSQSQHQQFLSNFTSKNSYNPQNYFQSAKLLQKQKQYQQQNIQKSRNSSNSNLLLIGGHSSATSPMIQNWHTQLGLSTNQNAFTDLMIGNQTLKNGIAGNLQANIVSQKQSKNKTQQQIIIPSLNNQNNGQSFDPSSIIKTAQDNSKQANSQQIQAAIIKKIQNNFQLSFTNSFNQNPGTLTTNNFNNQQNQQIQQSSQTEKISPIKNLKQPNFENEELRIKEYHDSQLNTKKIEEHEKKQKDLAESLRSIEKKMIDQLTDIQNSILDSNHSNSQSDITKKKAETFMKVFDELITKESPFQSIIQKLRKGFKDCIKDYENQNDQGKHFVKECEFKLKEKQVDFKRIEQDLRDVERNEQECRTQIQNMASQIDERDDQIENLEIELDHQRRKFKDLFKQQMRQPLNKGGNKPIIIQNDDQSMEHQDMYEQLQEALNENNELKQIAKEMQEELDYGKQRENKLMFFLFILKEKGFPISEVFEEEIKDIPTTRFSTHFDDEYKQMYYQIKCERKEARKEKRLELINGGFGIQRDEVLALSPLTERVFTYVKKRELRQSMIDRVAINFGNLSQNNSKPRIQNTASNIDFDQVPYLVDSQFSDSNYLPVTVQKAKAQKKPSIVPKLDLMRMPHQKDSDSSSDSLGQDSEGKPKRGPNPRQLKKIFDKYNIMTCARNIMQQEKDIKKRRRLLAEKRDRSFTSSSFKNSLVIVDQQSNKQSSKKKRQ
ncbi:UNKNOWN [Stylonychia lemnae]|uniref:Uncharacterized protein n=1 Tax=Stylonychia lemnae TaxID=5949 RepID=A0A078A5P3_STYLE|nr:UNKNOWN [Stylonychia lemnae]|eukprot:CDW77231.1 UNKNOWN [Stylonychia lemnae]